MLKDNQIEILITRFFSGEASPEEAIQLEDWASMAPSNRSYLNNCSKIFSMNIDINYIDNKHLVWENIKGAIDKNASAVKIKAFNWRSVGVAASLILILTISLLINNVFKKENDTIVYQAGSSPKKISLKDRSEIVVSPNSSITIDKEYGIGNRKIKLNGSAYFSVIHDPSQAFIIDMNTLHIKDLGTLFNVVTSPAGDTVFINVIEGEVSVYDDFGSSENIGAGEKAIYIKPLKELQGFRTKQIKGASSGGPAITATKPGERKVGTNGTDTIPMDPPVENYPYPSYPSQYPLQEGYTPEGKRVLMYKDSVQTRRLITDIFKDGLVTGEQLLSFKLSNTEFIINGKSQSNSIFQRYKKKYAPSAKEGEEWDWSHNFTTPPNKHQ